MTTNIIELTKFKLNSNVTLPEYFTKFKPVLEQFLSKQVGFIGIQHLQNDEGLILNYVQWENLQDAQDAAEKAMTQDVCLQWFSLMSPETITMEHYTVIG